MSATFTSVIVSASLFTQTSIQVEHQIWENIYLFNRTVSQQLPDATLLGALAGAESDDDLHVPEVGVPHQQHLQQILARVALKGCIAAAHQLSIPPRCVVLVHSVPATQNI